MVSVLNVSNCPTQLEGGSAEELLIIESLQSNCIECFGFLECLFFEIPSSGRVFQFYSIYVLRNFLNLPLSRNIKYIRGAAE
jgi:hypothetical protein